jgi:ADP-ribose pyrophosphatase
MARKMKVVYSAGSTKFEALRYRGSTFYFLDLPDVVVMLPLVANGRIVLERQYRPVIGKYIYELPAGKLKRRESPRKAAFRELKEETGYTASDLTFLLKAYTSPGVMTHFTHFYVASGLRKGKTMLDRDENISLTTVTLEKALQMIKTNEIEDSKSIVALLYYSSFVR